MEYRDLKTIEAALERAQERVRKCTINLRDAEITLAALVAARKAYYDAQEVKGPAASE
jgi:hypothetical protein